MERRYDHHRLVSSSSNITLRVRDLVTAQRWYREMLGLNEVLFRSRHIVVLDLGGAGSLMLRVPSPGSPLADAEASLAGCAAFSTQDISATHRILTERGVRVSAIAATNTARFFSLEDPDGNPLSIGVPHEQLPPPL